MYDWASMEKEESDLYCDAELYCCESSIHGTVGYFLDKMVLDSYEERKYQALRLSVENNKMKVCGISMSKNGIFKLSINLHQNPFGDRLCSIEWSTN